MCDIFQILIPPKDLLPKLRKEAEDGKFVLQQIKGRVDWARYQEREKRKEEEAKEQERGEKIEKLIVSSFIYIIYKKFRKRFGLI